VRELRIWSLYAPRQAIDLAQGEGKPRWATWPGLVMFYALVPCAVLGVRKLGRRSLPLLAPVVLVALNAALFYGLLRFRVPAEVSLVVLAGVGVASPRSS
jgi:uncharacterized membrane protein YoaK (UPF0700 family)